MCVCVCVCVWLFLFLAGELLRLVDLRWRSEADHCPLFHFRKRKWKDFPHSSVGKRICLQCRRPQFNSWVGKIPWTKDRLPTPVFLGFPCGSACKEFACNVGDLRSIPGLGRFPGEGKGSPLQYSGLENSVDCIIHGVAKSLTRLSDFHL